LAISSQVSKILWGRAAGRCSKPDCREVLIATTKKGESYLIGEMAHEVARNIGGPRAIDVKGSDEYENLILLCPTHHRIIDKAPKGEFSVDELKEWKRQHEAWVDSLSEVEKVPDFHTLARLLLRLLDENYHYFSEYGPKSKLAVDNPGSNSHAIWVARKLDTILPNNRKIINALDRHQRLFPDGFQTESVRFKDHTLAYEQNQHDRMDVYPNFPLSFLEAVQKGSAQ